MNECECESVRPLVLYLCVVGDDHNAVALGLRANVGKELVRELQFGYVCMCVV